MPSAVFHIVGPNGRHLKDCEVNSVTTIGYAAMHIASQMGADDDVGGMVLLEYPSCQQVPESDIAGDWDGKKLILAMQPRESA